MQISSESIKVGHPDIVADTIAANIIATILDREHQRGMDKIGRASCRERV